MSNIKLGYITCKSTKEANVIASILLDKKLIACGNIIPKIHSYENPCIVFLDLQKGNKTFMNWVNSCLK